MITTEQAKDLIDTQKYVIKDDNILSEYHIVQTFPMNEKIELAVGNGDDSMMFTWQINQGQKDSLRMSLHCQQYESNIGLFRVDYNRGHKNPSSAPNDLPIYVFVHILVKFLVKTKATCIFTYQATSNRCYGQCQ